jgi:hypothetical protein
MKVSREIERGHDLKKRQHALDSTADQRKPVTVSEAIRAPVFGCGRQCRTF